MDRQLEIDENLEKGNDEPFSLVYRQYYRPVVNYISRILTHRSSSEEIAQEVFIKLFRNIKSLSFQSLRGWIYTVAHHETINYIKRNSRFISSLDQQYVEPSSEDMAHESMERKAARELVKNTILKLPKNQAAAIYYKDIEGCTYEEIARKMGISYKAVKSLICRGRKNFIRYYEEMKGDEL